MTPRKLANKSGHQYGKCNTCGGNPHESDNECCEQLLEALANLEINVGDVTISPAQLAAICEKLNDLDLSVTLDPLQWASLLACLDTIKETIGDTSVTLDPSTIADLIAALEDADLNVTVEGGTITANIGNLDELSAIIKAAVQMAIEMADFPDLDVNIINDDLVISLSADALAELQAAFTAAIEDAEFPELNVNVTNDEIVISGTVGLDAATLAALEEITVNGIVGLDADTIAAFVAALEDLSITGEVDISPESIQALVDALEAATLTVTIDGGTLTVDGTVDIGNLDDLTAALDGLNVVVSGTVSVDSLPDIVLSADTIADLAATIAAALDGLTVTIGGQPIDVTGTVSIDNFGDLVDLLDGLAVVATIDNIDDLQAAFEAALNNADDIDVFATLDAQQLADLIAAIAASDVDDTDDDIRPVVTESKNCIKDADGNVVPNACVYNVIRFNETADLTSFEEVYLVDGVFVATLPAGMTVGKCCDGTPALFKKQFHYAGIENTGTVFSESHKIEVTNSDGTTTIVDVAAGTNWFNQMEDIWQAAFAAAYPDMCEVKNHWYPWKDNPHQTIDNADFDFVGAIGQYIQFEFCPGDVYPVSAEIIASSNPARIGKQLITGQGEGPITYETVCISCDDDCNEEPSKCAIPIGEDFPVLPPPVCVPQTIGPLCEIVPQVDEDGIAVAPTDADIVVSEIYKTFIFCNGEIADTTTYTLDEDGNAVEHTLTVGNLLVDCDTLEEPADLVPECPDGLTWQMVQVNQSMELFDNSNFVDADGNIIEVPKQIPSTASYTITHTLADGTVLDFIKPAGANSLFSYRNWMRDQFPDCSFVMIGANHPKFPFGPYGPIPWGVTVGPEIVFAGAFAMICCENSPAFVSIEVTASSDPLFLGATRPVSRHINPNPTKLYQAVDCGALYYQDCEGNPVVAPPKCCVRPCDVTSSTQTTCEIVTGCKVVPDVFSAGSGRGWYVNVGSSGANHTIEIGTNHTSGFSSASPLVQAFRSCVNNGGLVHGSYSDQATQANPLPFAIAFDNLISYTEIPHPTVTNDIGTIIVESGPPINDCDGQFQTFWNAHTDGSFAGATDDTFDDWVVLNMQCMIIEDTIETVPADRVEVCGPVDVNIQNQQVLPLTPCETCTVLPYEAGQIIDSPIVEVVGGTGSPQTLPNGPFSTIQTFAAALATQGYSVEIVGATIEVCGGTEPVIGYVLDDGTIIDATSYKQRDGLLVCDPNTAALSAQMDTLIGATQINNDLLSTLVACLCDCPNDPCKADVSVTDSDGNAFTPIGDAGPDQNFPAPALNNSAILSPVYQIQAPYPECAKGTVRLKLAFDHETDGGSYGGAGGGHDAFIVGVPAGGTWVAGSETNGIVNNGGTSITVGQRDNTSPWTLDRRVRCVELDVPVATLAAGFNLTFAAFGSISDGGEILHDFTVTPSAVQSQLDCSDCTADGGGGREEKKCSVQFKTSGLVSVLTDKGEAISSGPYDFPAPNAPPQSSANDAVMTAAAADIQAFLDANGGGTVTLEYISQSVIEIVISGTTCTILSASDDSNPGPHEFTCEVA